MKYYLIFSKLPIMKLSLMSTNHSIKSTIKTDFFWHIYLDDIILWYLIRMTDIKICNIHIQNK